MLQIRFSVASHDVLLAWCVVQVKYTAEALGIFWKAFWVKLLYETGKKKKKKISSLGLFYTSYTSENLLFPTVNVVII